jgi:Tfp pilus assembly protein PilV
MKKPLFRNPILSVGILAFAIMLAAASSRTQAGEQRHYDAHLHGIAHLNAAM